MIGLSLENLRNLIVKAEYFDGFKILDDIAVKYFLISTWSDEKPNKLDSLRNKNGVNENNKDFNKEDDEDEDENDESLSEKIIKMFSEQEFKDNYEDNFKEYFDMCNSLFNLINSDIKDLYNVINSRQQEKMGKNSDKEMNIISMMNMLRAVSVHVNNDINDLEKAGVLVSDEDDEFFAFLVCKIYENESCSKNSSSDIEECEQRYRIMFKNCGGDPGDSYLRPILKFFIINNNTVSIEKIFSATSIALCAFKDISLNLYLKFLSCCSVEQLEVIEKCNWKANMLGNSGRPDKVIEIFKVLWECKNEDMVKNIVKKSFDGFLTSMFNS